MGPALALLLQYIDVRTCLQSELMARLSQDQSAGTPAAAGDFGFKVLTSSDPAEKTKKLSAELANGRLAMMAIIGSSRVASFRFKSFCVHCTSINLSFGHILADAHQTLLHL